MTDRFERKWCLVVFGTAIAICGLLYGLTFNPILIVVFGFLVNMIERGYTALAYAYSPELFDIRGRSLGTGVSYGLGRLSNAIGPLVIAAPLHRHRVPQRLLLHRRHLAGRGGRAGRLRPPDPPSGRRSGRTADSAASS